MRQGWARFIVSEVFAQDLLEKLHHPPSPLATGLYHTQQIDSLLESLH